MDLALQLYFSGENRPLGWPAGRHASSARGRHVGACGARKSGPNSCPNSHQGLALLGQGFQKPHILTTFCSENATSTWRTFIKLYSPVDMGKALLHVERHPSSTSGTYPGANPRCLSANPSWCSSSETTWSIFFKFTVHS